MHLCDFVNFVFVVESHQINVSLFGKLNVARRLRGVCKYDAGRFDTERENFADFTRRSAVKRAADGCQRLKNFDVVVAFYLNQGSALIQLAS